LAADEARADAGACSTNLTMSTAETGGVTMLDGAWDQMGY